MSSKPKGLKYRNLHGYRDSIWYERVVSGRRYRENTKEPALPRDRPGWLEAWTRAARWRDTYELSRGIGQPRTHAGQVPTFEAMARRYLAEDMGHLAATTKADRDSHLKADGPVLRPLGAKPCDEISSATLRLWWNQEVTATGRSEATGHRYLASIAGVMNYAMELDFVRENPVDAFRRQLARRRRTKQGRASEAAHRNPIRDPEQLERVVAAALDEGDDDAALFVVLLDTGARLGEVLALRWRCVAWGIDDNDPRRHILIEASKSRGGEAGTPKSGKSRRVQLSRRARRALGDLYIARYSGNPGGYDPEGFIFENTDDRSFREGAWARTCARAGLVGHTPKDMRDTFASWLLTAGIPVQYVSKQLGHSTIGVTEQHYAEYLADGDYYVEPVRLGSGDVPADLLCRLPDSPQLPTAGDPYALPDFLNTTVMN